jgi:hypothetical protein
MDLLAVVLMPRSQQCGKLEPLARFEGTKRSCRTSLVKRKANAEKMHQRLQQQQTEEQPPKRCQQRMRPMQLVAVAVDAMKLDGGAPAVAAAAAGAVHAVNFMGVLGGGSDHSSCSASAAGPVAALCDAWTAVGQQEQQGWVPAGAANADTDMLSALVQREISSALAAAASLPGSQQQLAYIAEASATAADEDDLTELEIEAMIEAELAAAGLINNGQLACCTASAPVQQQQWSGAHAAPDFYASSTPAAAAELHSRMTSLHAEYAQLQQVLSGLEQLVGQPRPYAAGGAQQQLNMYSVSGNHSSGSWC